MVLLYVQYTRIMCVYICMCVVYNKPLYITKCRMNTLQYVLGSFLWQRVFTCLGSYLPMQTFIAASELTRSFLQCLQIIIRELIFLLFFFALTTMEKNFFERKLLSFGKYILNFLFLAFRKKKTFITPKNYFTFFF